MAHHQSNFWINPKTIPRIVPSTSASISINRCSYTRNRAVSRGTHGRIRCFRFEVAPELGSIQVGTTARIGPARVIRSGLLFEWAPTSPTRATSSEHGHLAQPAPTSTRADQQVDLTLIELKHGANTTPYAPKSSPPKGEYCPLPDELFAEVIATIKRTLQASSWSQSGGRVGPASLFATRYFSTK